MAPSSGGSLRAANKHRQRCMNSALKVSCFPCCPGWMQRPDELTLRPSLRLAAWDAANGPLFSLVLGGSAETAPEGALTNHASCCSRRGCMLCGKEGLLAPQVLSLFAFVDCMLVKEEPLG